MKRVVFIITMVFLAVSLGQAQHLFSENKGQLPEKVLYKCRLNYGALFLEKNALTYNFADINQYQHSYAHHGKADVKHTHHKGNKTDLPDKLNFHAYQVEFLGALSEVKTKGEEKQPDYENYFIGKNPKHWASNVGRYAKVCYDDIYRGIDLVFYDNGKGLKYDWIIESGGNPDHIRLRYKGLSDIKLRRGNLILKTTLTTTKELAPYAYQIINGDSISIKCQYVLEDSVVSFAFPNGYDTSSDLIIDPSLVFSTYTGSTADNWGFTATWDYNDNVFSGGIVFDFGYPVSLGAYQTDFAGGVPPTENPTYYANGCDVGIIKYNADGTQRLFATYLGGASGEEMPHSMIVNNNNELIVFGTTGSSDFPVTANAYDDSFNGGDSLRYDNVISFPDGSDIYVVKFSEDGTQLLGGTYFGGSGNDGLNFKIEYAQSGYIQMYGNDSLYYNYGDGARGEVMVDDENNIFIGANTFSTDIQSGLNVGFQPSNSGGLDGLVAKFSSDLSTLHWFSYLGGSEDDAIYSIYPDLNSDVLVSGGTCSTDFPTTAGAYQTNYLGGSTDAFVSKIEKFGNTLKASSFYGSDEYDQAYFVRTDKDNDVYIYGQTKAQANTLVYNAAYFVPNSGQFVACFNETLSSRLWSTVVGRGAGHPILSPSAFAVDVCNRIYLAGWGREWVYTYYDNDQNYYTWDDEYGTKNLPITSDALQSTTDGQDFYIMVLSREASALEYATFFGELHDDDCGYSGRDHVDGGTSRFDNKGNVIQSVCASCGGCQGFPTYPNPGVWSSTNESTNCNNAVFKINIIENLAEASFHPVPNTCVSTEIEFVNNSLGISYLWDFGDGTPTSTEFQPSHIYTEEGTYTVTLIAYDSTACNYSDTVYHTVTVELPQHIDLPEEQICPGESVQIGPLDNFGNDVSFEWSPSNGLSASDVQNPITSPEVDTEYILLVHGICTDTVFQTVSIKPIDLSLLMPQDTSICPGETINFTAEVQGNYSGSIWSDNESFTHVISSTLSLTAQPAESTTYWFQVTEPECNTSLVGSVNANVHQFNYQLTPDTIICLGDTIELSIVNLNASDVLSYNWSPTEYIVSGENTASPTVQPNVASVFTVNIQNQMGCVTSDEVSVSIDNIQTNIQILQDILCYGDCIGALSVETSGYPPYQYLWSNGETEQSISQLCQGLYHVSVTDSLGCSVVDEINIKEPPELVTEFVSVQQPICDGIGYGAATISASGGTPDYYYSWDDGSYSAENVSLLTGEHVAMVTDANGCDTTLNIEIIPPNGLEISLSGYHNNECYDECSGSITVEVTGGTTPYSYLWSNGATDSTISNLCAGIYSATVIDADNCVIHECAAITEPDELKTFIADGTIACYGGSTCVQLLTSGGTMPYTYLWNTGETSWFPTNIVAGNYTVTVTDAHGCTEIIEFSIPQPDKLDFESEVVNMLCDDVCNGEIVVTPFGGTPPYEYFWVENDTYGNTLSNLCAGNYVLFVNDDNHCLAVSDFTIINEMYFPPLDITADRDTIFVGTSTPLHATNTELYSYHWYPSESLSSDSLPDINAFPTETTTYYLDIVDNSTGCMNKDSIVISVHEISCGEPYLYVPNAFSPDNDGENDFFRPYAPVGVIREMYFAVYNRWGEVMYETTNINDKGWDGTFKGEKLPPDVYIFLFKATCIDNEQFIKKGNVTLLR